MFRRNFAEELIWLAVGIALMACLSACGSEPETDLVYVGTESQSPLFPGGDWQSVNGETQVIQTLARQADGSFWRWSPASSHHRAAVRVRTGTGAGSGICLATAEHQCLVLTNHHVIEGHRTVTIDWTSGAKARGDVIAWRHATQEDIAVVLVRSPDPNWIGLPIASQEPPAGTDLEMVAFGGPDYGRKRSFYGKRLQTSGLRIDAATISGDSGSGILWNRCIVGVNYAGPGIALQLRGVGLVYPASSGVTPTFLRQWLSQVCPPHGCTPIYRDPGGSRGGEFYNPPAAPTTPAVPQSPATPAPAAKPNYVIVQPADLEAIKREIAEGLPSGPRGPQGPPGKLTEADISLIVTQVAAGIKQPSVDEIVRAVLEKVPAGDRGIVDLRITSGYLYATYSNGRTDQIGKIGSDGPAYFEIVPKQAR